MMEKLQARAKQEEIIKIITQLLQEEGISVESEKDILKWRVFFSTSWNWRGTQEVKTFFFHFKDLTVNRAKIKFYEPIFFITK